MADDGLNGYTECTLGTKIGRPGQFYVELHGNVRPFHFLWDRYILRFDDSSVVSME